MKIIRRMSDEKMNRVTKSRYKSGRSTHTSCPYTFAVTVVTYDVLVGADSSQVLVVVVVRH